jgi:hypothetical protein
MAWYFEFEAAFVKTMRCIPMQVRCRLDAVGIRLKLKEWVRLWLEERRELAELPGETAEDPGEFPVAEPPAWLDDSAVWKSCSAGPGNPAAR